MPVTPKRRRNSYPTPPSSRRRMSVLDRIMSSPTPAPQPRGRKRSDWKTTAKAAVDIAAAVSPEVATAKKLLNAVMGQPKKKRSYGSKDNSHLSKPFRQGRKITTLADRYCNKGMVEKLEIGGVVTETSKQVVYVAHTTFPAEQVMRCVFESLLKKLFGQANLTCKSRTEALVADQYYTSEVRVSYKVYDGDVVNVKKFILNTTASLLSVANQMIVWLRDTLAGTASLPQQLLSIRFYAQFGSATDALLLMSELDLTTVRFQLYSKSFLKLQNRTINSTGNNDSDDVDNVPISGRFFEYPTNGTIYRDYNTPAGAANAMVTCDNANGLLPRPDANTFSGTNFFNDLPERTQFIGCKKSGSCVLQPGQIRTSLLYDKLNIGFNKLVRVLFAVLPNNSLTKPNQIWLGKTRLFGWEKALNAVSMSATNQFNIAYELQYEVGSICIAKKSSYTAPGINQATET